MTAASPCAPGAAGPAGTERWEITSGGVTRTVERSVPASGDSSAPIDPAPLLVNLHGFSSDPEEQSFFSGLPAAATDRGYIVLTPLAEPATVPVGDRDVRASFWNVRPDEATGIVDARDDVAFLADVIETTATHHCVDATRIYVTGNSNGAGMATALACELSDAVAAIAPVSGVNLASSCDDPSPVSVIAFHGDADPLVPYGGGAAIHVGSVHPSVEDRMAELAEAAGCEAQPEVSSPFEDIESRVWVGCETGVAVELHTVVGGGHTWPGMLNYVDLERLAEIGGEQELVEIAEIDLLEIAGHMTVNIEATTMLLDFFDDLAGSSP